MAEGINRVLYECSIGLKSPSDIDINSKLFELLQYDIKGLDYESFSKVRTYARTLDLPEDFLKELDFERMLRGVKKEI